MERRISLKLPFRHTLLALAGAILYRMRGGWNPLDAGTQVARIVFWVIPIIILMCFRSYYTDVPYWTCAISGIGAFLGLLIPHGEWFAIKSIKDTCVMSLIGLARVLLIVAPVIYFDLSIMLALAGGIMMGPSYALGKLLHLKDIGITLWGRKLSVGSTDYGELLSGAFIFLAISLTF